MQKLSEADKQHALRYYDISNIRKATDDNLILTHDRVVASACDLIEMMEQQAEANPAFDRSLAKKEFVAEAIEAEAKRRGLTL